MCRKVKNMEEIKLYDIDSIEFNELIDNARMELKYNNSEYKELQNEVSKIMKNIQIYNYFLKMIRL